MLFQDRRDAGKQLAARLQSYKGRKDVIVLGLARGGMVIADEVARALAVSLNAIVVRKIGAPRNAELALGAIAEDGEGVFNESLIQLLGVPISYLQKETEKQRKVLKERLALYRGKRAAPDLKGKIVILVDDGIATGASMHVAIRSMRDMGVQKLILAVPVAASAALQKLEKEVDEVVCLSAPAFFEAVGCFYRVFDQVSDEEIVSILDLSRN